MSSGETRLATLETKVAFQEDTIQQLNDALVGQQDRIDRLEARLEAIALMLAEQLRGGDERDAGYIEPPPPHY